MVGCRHNKGCHWGMRQNWQWMELGGRIFCGMQSSGKME